ncbi:glycosyl hydrolase [Pedobacter chinensis]|uniref:exo-alpha-sialidase n=1 Tax=Pedobacter chinensis TaxID=2282421 RepID=A0A369Q6J6_9SPHI|nr:sialidase family protein [Pedobacter chinensis]RDC57918.1 glycosyl hydrolase [Pedobacter chinensis]
MKNIILYIAFIISFNISFGQQIAQPDIEINQIRQPIFNNELTNPVIRLLVKSNENLTGVSLTGSLDKKSINHIQNIEVYDTDSLQRFSANKMIGSVSIKNRHFSVPLSSRLNAGNHYLWLNIILKPNTAIDLHIGISIKQLTLLRKKISVPENNYVFKTGSVVRKHGTDQINTFRIPGIATTQSGALISVYDIRYDHSKDLPANIDVGMSRSIDKGKTWEPMKIIMDMGAPHDNNGVGDPAVLYDPVTKTIWVVALWSKGNRSIAGSKPGLLPDETGQLVIVHSKDDGNTWSEPVSITSQVKNPKWNLFFNGPGTGSVMKDGTLVFPAQYWDENKMPHATIIYSKDHGKSWNSGIGAKSNTTESAVVETTPGTLMLNMRDNRGKFRSISTTTDFGQTWVTHSTSANTLADPVCMASLIKAKVRVKGVLKDVLFFSNVNSTKDRKNLTIKASLDLGETWMESHELLIDERSSFGYSALTLIDENTIGLIYEGVRDLFFVSIPVKDVIR